MLSQWHHAFPAAFLRRNTELGRIAPNYLASLVHLDGKLRVPKTWIEGRPTADGSRSDGVAGIT